MTTTTCPNHVLEQAETEAGVEVDVDLDVDGWQALAHATLGRALTVAEMAAVETLAPAHALDLLFPDLPDAARHEALWALG